MHPPRELSYSSDVIPESPVFMVLDVMQGIRCLKHQIIVIRHITEKNGFLSRQQFGFRSE